MSSKFYKHSLATAAMFPALLHGVSGIPTYAWILLMAANWYCISQITHELARGGK